MWITVMMLAAAPALAAETKFEGTQKEVEEADKPEATASVELGGVYTTGNAVFYTVNGGARGSYKWSRNKLTGVAGANVGGAVIDADGDGTVDDAERAAGFTRNIQRSFANGRYDRFFSEKDSLYVLAGAFVDPFAGYDLRSNQQIGYSRQLVKNDDTTLVAEVGFDWAQENYVAGVDPGYLDVFAARLMLGLAHKFNENVSFTDTFEVYENVVDYDDVRILNTATLSSKLSDKFSIKLSHSLIFDNVPVPGFRKLDQTTMVTMVATLL